MKKIILIVGGIIVVAILGRLGWAYYQIQNNTSAPIIARSNVSAIPVISTQPSAPITTSLSSATEIKVETTVQSQQMIIAKQTTVQFGATTAFKISKYPQDATSWTFRLDCPLGLVVNIQSVAPDGKLDGIAVNCNQDIALDKAPYSKYSQSVLFVMQFSHQGEADQIVTIVSKTFNSSGTLLNQSSAPITVQGSTSGLVKAIISNSRALAELFYDSNGKSYEGVCTKPNSFAYPPNTILTKQVELVKNSDSVVCKDSPTAWAISALPKGSTSQYWCSDSIGNVLLRNSPITSTSCK